ncbi:16534_t:CDS:2 [Rhizophagus irregularis]|nr:16534_t:CDS:2 [Rhizophagus irregularis]
MVNWQAFRRRVLHERKIKRDLCKLREDLADQALKFGFIREKFIDWISSISAELLSTQTLEYWLLSYVSETASSDANFWYYLEQQTPRYWVENWIKQLANRPSSEFNSFINNANLNELINYEHALHPTPIHVVNKEPVNGDDNELRLLLQTELGQQADESTLFYHTTNLWGAENIITEGIDFGECSRRQDFGGRTVSYYLNNNFKNAVEFARQRVLNSPAIIVYHIPATLLGQYDHLNLSGMFFSGGPYRIKGVK